MSSHNIPYCVGRRKNISILFGWKKYLILSLEQFDAVLATVQILQVDMVSVICSLKYETMQYAGTLEAM